MKNLTLILLLISGLMSCKQKIAEKDQSDFTRSKYLIDALDPASWSGITMVDTNKNVAAFRFASYENRGDGVVLTSGKEKDYAVNYFNNGDTLYHSVTKVDFKASDGSYASLQWQTASDIWYLQWARPLENGVLGSLSLENHDAENVIGKGILVEFFNPWDEGEIYFLSGDTVRCTSGQFYVIFDKKPAYIMASPDSLIRRDVHMEALAGNKPDVQYFQGKFLYLYFENTSQLSFKGWMDDGKMDQFAFDSFSTLLSEKREDRISRRPVIQGEYHDVISAISDNLNWMISYIPDTGLVYIPAGRTWDWGGWAIFAWDSYFNSLLLSLDNPTLAKKNLRATNFIQYPNGNIPNYRSGHSGSVDHSQNPVGSYLVWKIYLKTGDKEFLRWNYEPLKRWHYWWREVVETGYPRRDGNGDGLFEWGADQNDTLGWEPGLKAAMYESLDDSPIFDSVTYIKERWTMNMNAIDHNSYQALDANHLAMIAAELGFYEDAEIFKDEYNRLGELINHKMWNEKTGMYHDLFWDGKFNPRMDPTNFYPLLAGIAPKERAEKMMISLTDTSKFWGEYILPSITRDDPAFPDQIYCRGSIWPPLNYLTYQGLKFYKYDSLAAELAWKSMTLFMNNYRETGNCNEHYDSRTGKGLGQRFQSWGPLFAIMLIEEIIDFEPNGGLRVGTFLQEPMTLENIVLRGKNYSIETGNGLQLSIDGEMVINSEVPVVIRNLEIDNRNAICEINAYRDGTIEFPELGKKVKVKKGINNISL